MKNTIVNRIIDVFHDEYPELTVMKIANYDGRHYIVNAFHNPRNTEIDSWYGFDNTANRIVSFSPLEDLNKFNAASTQRVIYKK